MNMMRSMFVCGASVSIVAIYFNTFDGYMESMW